MKLLFDHNLAPKLVAQLADLYPGSIHVRDVRLAEAGDEEIWRYAREQALVIISKDSDFRQRSFLQGPPPKIVWVRLGNGRRRASAPGRSRGAAPLRSKQPKKRS